jgi:hypothetical protein
LAVLSLALFAASLPARYDILAHPREGVLKALGEMGLSTNFYATYNLGLEVLFALVFSLMAILIVALKWRDASALFFPFMMLMVGTAAIPILPTMGALVAAEPAMLPLVRLVTFIAWVSVFIFFCIFPDGSFPTRWSMAYAIIAVAVSIPWNLFPDSPLSPWTWPAPVLGLFELAIWGTGIYIQIDRYRHVSDPVQRQQTRWVVFGLGVSVSGIVAFYLPRAVNPSLGRPTDQASLIFFLVSSTFICLSALFTPLGIALSILRYKLWAIDFIINRTLVYGLLTTLLALIYVSSVILLQSIFNPLLGQESDLAIVISTLAIATLFLPLRRRVQTFIDLQFYRRKYDTTRILAQLTQTVSQEVDLQRLAERLVEVVDDTMQPAHVSLWLRDPANKPHGERNAVQVR